jgi:3-deoxy-D-manno-octulosonic-acid transferase
MSVGYLIYNLLVTAALPLVPLWLVIQPRFRSGIAERFGLYAQTKAEILRGARPIWIHAASVGEVGAARALIDVLRASGAAKKILLSTFTNTGNEMARRGAGADAVIYLPLDHPLVVRRALSRVDPAALIIVETEIWPNLLRHAARRGIPVLLLSGRLSQRALQRYRRFATFFRAVLRSFAAMGVQSPADAERLTALGADPARVKVTGNLKQRIPDVLIQLSPGSGDGAAGQHPLLVAGSTHRGEEALTLEAFAALRKHHPDLRLALAPRHPERFAEVADLVRQAGLTLAKKSQLPDLAFGADVLLLDTLGDLCRLYARADVAFVGGSLVKVGGHNLLEPALLKKPVLFGPHTENVKGLAAALRESGGGIEVRDAPAMARAVHELLGDPACRRRAGEEAYAVATRDSATAERSLELLARYVDLGGAPALRAGPSAA